MKKAIVGLAVGLMLGAALPAGAHHDSSALAKRIDKLNSRLNKVENRLRCIDQVEAVTQYGNTPSTPGQGYRYLTGSGDIVTTALDFTEASPNTAVGAYMVTADPECVTLNKGFKLRKSHGAISKP